MSIFSEFHVQVMFSAYAVTAEVGRLRSGSFLAPQLLVTVNTLLASFLDTCPAPGLTAAFLWLPSHFVGDLYTHFYFVVRQALWHPSTGSWEIHFHPDCPRYRSGFSVFLLLSLSGFLHVPLHRIRFGQSWEK